MDISGMSGFLSEGELERHLDYLEAERLRHSVEVKSAEWLRELDYFDLRAMRSHRRTRREVAPRLLNILMHEVYFSSFVTEVRPSECVRRHYGSEDAFLYGGVELSEQVGQGFIYVYMSGRGVPMWAALCGLGDGLLGVPLLAVDLYEHAYFGCYGFDRRAYLRAALAHFDLGRLSVLKNNS